MAVVRKISRMPTANFWNVNVVADIRPYCVRCAKMSDGEYELLSNRKNIHWFCGDWDTKATQSILLAKEMDKKLGEFMKKVNENLKNIEKDIEMKLAEKANTAHAGYGANEGLRNKDQ